MTNIKNKILHIVQDSKVQMIPRWKFVLYSSLGIVGLFFAFLALLFIVSLVLFLLSKYGFLYLPFFGFRATLHLITGVPIFLGAVGLILVGVIELLARHYTFSFRKPLVTTLLIIIIAALAIGFVVSLTPLHRLVRGYARDHHFDGFRDMYERPGFGEGLDGRGVLRGEVVSTTTDSLTLSLFNDTLKMVYATATGESFKDVKIDEDILVFGVTNGDRFEVIRIRSAPEMPFEDRGERHLAIPRNGIAPSAAKMK